MEDKELKSIKKTRNELFVNLLITSKKIKSLIVEDKIEELNEKLQDRREIMMLIDVLNQQMIDITKEKSKAAATGNENQDIIREIEATEKENLDLAQEKLEEYSGQLRTLNQMKKGIVSYAGTHKKSDGVFIDAKK